MSDADADSDAGDTDPNDPRRDVPRQGAEPFPFSKLYAMSRNPSSVGINDLTVALHISFNRMKEIRKIARRLLRVLTGHVVVQDAVRPGRNKKVYQKAGQHRQAWQVDRPSGDSNTLKRLGVYSRFIAEVPEFQMARDANGQLDHAAMAKTTQVDPADNTKEVPCATWDMKQDYMKRIIHKEMDFMKDNERARDPATEGEIVFGMQWRGSKRKAPDYSQPTQGRKKSKRKSRTAESQNLGLYLADDPNPASTCHIVPSITSLLRQTLDSYPPKYGFPYDQIRTTKLWTEVAKLPGVGDDPQADGWLKFTKPEQDSGSDKPPPWNVQTGAELGALLEQFVKDYKDDHSVTFKLYFVKGECDIETETFYD